MALAIVNREPKDQPIPSGTLVWRTCLREVAFGEDPEDISTNSDDARPLVEGDAYRLLLEILCGLQSPMLGETQVLGQFKAFLAALDRSHGWLNRLGQRLLTDAREIRTQHLQGLGSRSYGSAVRRYLTTCRHTVLIGTGKLANEVLPFLADEGRTVDQWGRAVDPGIDGPAVRTDAITYRPLDELEHASVSTQPTVLIIAAPVPSAVVDRVAERYSGLLSIIDLRGELGSAPLRANVPVVTLQDLFAQMSASNGAAIRHVEAAKADIASRSRRYELRDELRPFGWDDLCA